MTNVFMVRTFCKSKNTIMKEEEDDDMSNAKENCDGTNEGMDLFLYTSRTAMTLRKSQRVLVYTKHSCFILIFFMKGK